MATSPTHDDMANAIRFLAVDAVEKAKSGHPGLPMGMADVATVLFRDVLKFDAADPHWPDRDRFVLSGGHGSMLLYSLLYLTGVGGDKGLTIEDLEAFRQVGSRTPGPSRVRPRVGVETTTGPLGQGISTAVGMALAERMMAAQFPAVVDHRTYVLASDGDLMEGVSHEAIAIAGHYRLSKLIVFWDNNDVSIDGRVSVLNDNVDQVARFQAAGWNASHIDGRDTDRDLERGARRAELRQADDDRLQDDDRLRPPDQAGNEQGARRGGRRGRDRGRAEEPELAVRSVRDPGRRACGVAGRRARAARPSARPGRKGSRSSTRCGGTSSSGGSRGELPKDFDSVIDAYKRQLAEQAPEIATRKAGEAALNVIAPAVPELVTGSADLTPSNNTKVAATKEISPDDFTGRYIHWGIREHGMSAACNGISVHGGFIPSGSSFLCFTDYARPALRIAALMKIRVVHVFTHDSIGLGEDGPTHQPVEHLASLRAMPNMYTVAPGRQRRDGRVLASGAQARAFAFDHRPHPAEPAGAAQGPCRGQSLRPRRLRDCAGGRRSGRLDLRLRF